MSSFNLPFVRINRINTYIIIPDRTKNIRYNRGYFEIISYIFVYSLIPIIKIAIRIADKSGGINILTKLFPSIPRNFTARLKLIGAKINPERETRDATPIKPKIFAAGIINKIIKNNCIPTSIVDILGFPIERYRLLVAEERE